MYFSCFLNLIYVDISVGLVSTWINFSRRVSCLGCHVARVGFGRHCVINRSAFGKDVKLCKLIIWIRKRGERRTVATSGTRRNSSTRPTRCHCYQHHFFTCFYLLWFWFVRFHPLHIRMWDPSMMWGFISKGYSSRLTRNDLWLDTESDTSERSRRYLCRLGNGERASPTRGIGLLVVDTWMSLIGQQPRFLIVWLCLERTKCPTSLH